MQVSKDTSAQIKVCRVLCIFFLMYVHVYPGLATFDTPVSRPLAFLDFFVVDLLGRASVPALTLISGFLMAIGFERKGALAVNASRVPKILVPMVTWNLVAILLAWLIYKVLGHSVRLFQEVQSLDALSVVLFKVLAVQNEGATDALNFLRDLLVCGCFIVPVVWGVKKGGLVFVGLVAAWGVWLGFDPVIYRATIPIFFVAGVYAAHARGHLALGRRLTAVVMAMMIGVVALDAWGGMAAYTVSKPAAAGFDLLRRSVVSAFFLVLALAIARTRWSAWFFRFERTIFLVFLAHSALFLVLWGLWRPVMGTGSDGPYLLFFIANPVVCLALITLIPSRGWQALPAWLQVVIRGTVSRSRPAVARSPAPPVGLDGEENPGVPAPGPPGASAAR